MQTIESPQKPSLVVVFNFVPKANFKGKHFKGEERGVSRETQEYFQCVLRVEIGVLVR